MDASAGEASSERPSLRWKCWRRWAVVVSVVVRYGVVVMAAAVSSKSAIPHLTLPG